MVWKVSLQALTYEWPGLERAEAEKYASLGRLILKVSVLSFSSCHEVLENLFYLIKLEINS